MGQRELYDLAQESRPSQNAHRLPKHTVDKQESIERERERERESGGLHEG